MNGLSLIGIPIAVFGWLNSIFWFTTGRIDVTILFAIMGIFGSIAVIDDLLFDEKIVKYIIDHLL